MSDSTGGVDTLRFPIGRFSYPDTVTTAEREQFLVRIAGVPSQLRALVEGLTDTRLNTAYRPGGWTIRQVVHHVPDSHMNSYVRFKLALTEDDPVIKPYDEGAWALLGDTAKTPVTVSLTLLEKLHERWVILLRSLTDAQWQRRMRHPENGLLRLDQVLALYAWHGDHHVAHVRNALSR